MPLLYIFGLFLHEAVSLNVHITKQKVLETMWMQQNA